MAAKRDVEAKGKAKEPAAAPAPAAIAEAEETVADFGLEMGRVIVFSMDGQRYALPIDVVQEIQQIVAFSEIPDHQAAVVGVINVRGQVVPAVDLRRLVGMPAREYGLQTPMVFVRTAKGLVALIVDEVEDVIEVPPNSTQAPSRMYALADKLLCVVRLDTDLVFVFDIDRLVPDEAADVGRR
jgi:purine-binding chemotaxis protein CheW